MRHSHRKAKSRDDIVSHFQKRCMERLGYIVGQKELREAMANNRLRVHSRQSNTKTRFWWTGKDGREVVVVYDRLRHAFVTVLLPEYLIGNEKGEGE